MRSYESINHFILVITPIPSCAVKHCSVCHKYHRCLYGAWSKIPYVIVNHIPREFNKNMFEITIDNTKMVLNFPANSSPRVLHKYVAEPSHHRFRLGLVTCSVPSHYLNQWWLLIKHTPRNRPNYQSMFIDEIALKVIVCNLPSLRPGGGYLTLQLLIS